MTHLLADASATSAVWMTPRQLDEILAASWRQPPTPAVRTLRSDAEAPASGRVREKGFADLLIQLAAILVAAHGRQARANLFAGATPQRIARAMAAPTNVLLDPVRSELKNLSVPVAGLAKAVVDRLATELSRMKVDDLPPIHASIGKDGAFLMEWTLGRRRLGLNVEAQPDESSWYYVSFDPGRVESASGPLSEVDLPVQLRRIVRG